MPSEAGPARGPVVGQGPLTSSAPLNIGIGTAAVGGVNTGMVALQSAGGDPPWANGMAIILNLLMQPLKKQFPLLQQHEWAILVMMAIAFVLGYIVIFHGDSAKAFINMGYSTVTALGNYKGDKASGLNILPPAPERPPPLPTNRPQGHGH